MSFQASCPEPFLVRRHHCSYFAHTDLQPAALPIAALSCLPLAAAQHVAGTKLAGLYICRLVLVCDVHTQKKHTVNRWFSTQGSVWVASLLCLKSTITRRMGPTVAAAFVLLTAVQFHLPFYASRTLPNILAMPLTNTGLALWLDPSNRPWRTRLAVLLLTAAAVVVRCDMVLLLGLVGIHMLVTGVLSRRALRSVRTTTIQGGWACWTPLPRARSAWLCRWRARCWWTASFGSDGCGQRARCSGSTRQKTGTQEQHCLYMPSNCTACCIRMSTPAPCNQGAPSGAPRHGTGTPPAPCLERCWPRCHWRCRAPLWNAVPGRPCWFQSALWRCTAFCRTRRSVVLVNVPPPCCCSSLCLSLPSYVRERLLQSPTCRSGFCFQCCRSSTWPLPVRSPACTSTATRGRGGCAWRLLHTVRVSTDLAHEQCDDSMHTHARPGLVAASAAVSLLFAHISAANYPGGAALQRLHALASPNATECGGLRRGVAWDECGALEHRVHIGVLPAMTGVTRFGELEACWVYSKV